ncbi:MULTISPECIES: xylose isomerase [unclassified Staphylococcus]|uniref:xylose isomerase n=1 Tax=unclassified Staphylococcus TaxID=91994 RepID=UPI0021CE9E06|nr:MULTISPECIES: xylose isomerase [unclassified Staphylococcus]UXR78463.1 xylose isomerase [Staphylococcus sp. IVB6227]UXR82621.1 xylose isomerase [Staphylococcus sp. IVB6214]
MTYFNIDKVTYEGPTSTNPFSFKYYNADEKIGDKTMKEHLRFSVAYWHTFTADLSDPFGTGTAQRDWDNLDEMDKAKARVEAIFEFMDKTGIEYFCFHDVDIAPEGKTLAETNANLDVITDLIKEKMDATGKKLLWNTANNFTHERFVHGAATSSHADVFAYTAAKVKKSLEIAKKLDAENFVFWGGREGYESLLNTDMKLELDNLARFFKMAKAYADEIGFTGQFLIEPKPKEPTSHQYDTDVATAHAFLQKYGLEDVFKFNIEANHATLAGHTFQHELRYARDNGMLGSVDANQGHPLLGWDTDEFPSDVYETTLAMYEILKNGGLTPGGLNFDAKPRRTSFAQEDLVLTHIVGMDAFALGLRVAHKMIEDRFFEDIVDNKYASYKDGLGAKIVNDTTSFAELEAHALELGDIKLESDRLEVIKSRINQYILTINNEG